MINPYRFVRSGAYTRYNIYSSNVNERASCEFFLKSPDPNIPIGVSYRTGYDSGYIPVMISNEVIEKPSFVAAYNAVYRYCTGTSYTYKVKTGKSDKVIYVSSKYAFEKDPLTKEYHLMYLICNETDMAHTGRICLKGIENPTMTFYYLYGFAMANPLLIKTSVDGINFKTVAAIDLTDKDKQDNYIRAIVSLKDIANAESAYVGFEATVANTAENILIDNIMIFDQKDNDLMSKIHLLPPNLKTDEAHNVNVAVHNLGVNNIEKGAYTVNVFVDDMLAGSVQGPAVDSGEIINVVVPTTATIDMSPLSSIYVELAYNKDEYIDNNRSAIQNIKVRLPLFPKPEDLTAIDNKGSVTLNWKAPAAPLSEDRTVTEGFEDYEDFTIKNFGDWLLYDGDRRLTFSFGEGYMWPNRTLPHAFIVMTPSEVELTETGGKGLSSSWQPHSGLKMLMSSSSESDDWLISPELSGREQTISFFARATKSYSEKFEFKYSTTDTDINSFKNVGKEITVVGADWKEYNFDVPHGGRFFAIHKTTKDGLMFFI